MEPWERLFHNLRASRQTELANQFPAHVVCEWLGNTEAVAQTHYLTVTEEHYAQAVAQGGAGGGAQVVQQVVRKPSEASCNESQETPKASGVTANSSLFPKLSMDAEYARQDSNQPRFAEKNGHSGRAMHSGDAIAIGNSRSRQSIDPQLHAIIDAWPFLSEQARAQILDIVRKESNG